MQIDPLVPFNQSRGTVPSVVPFTIRENPSLLMLVEEMRKWISVELVPFINENIKELAEAWAREVDRLVKEWGEKVLELENAWGEKVLELETAWGKKIGELETAWGEKIEELDAAWLALSNSLIAEVNQKFEAMQQLLAEAKSARDSAKDSATAAAKSLSDMETRFNTLADALIKQVEDMIAEGGGGGGGIPGNIQDLIDAVNAAKTAAELAKTAAEAARDAAKVSETNAKTSETSAKSSQTSAKTSADNAKVSETKAKTSETNAKASEDSAWASKEAASVSEANAANSAAEAQGVISDLDTPMTDVFFNRGSYFRGALDEEYGGGGGGGGIGWPVTANEEDSWASQYALRYGDLRSGVELNEAFVLSESSALVKVVRWGEVNGGFVSANHFKEYNLRAEVGESGIAPRVSIAYDSYVGGLSTLVIAPNDGIVRLTPHNTAPLFPWNSLVLTGTAIQVENAGYSPSVDLHAIFNITGTGIYPSEVSTSVYINERVETPGLVFKPHSPNVLRGPFTGATAYRPSFEIRYTNEITIIDQIRCWTVLHYKGTGPIG